MTGAPTATPGVSEFAPPSPHPGLPPPLPIPPVPLPPSISLSQRAPTFSRPAEHQRQRVALTHPPPRRRAPRNARQPDDEQHKRREDEVSRPAHEAEVDDRRVGRSQESARGERVAEAVPYAERCEEGRDHGQVERAPDASDGLGQDVLDEKAEELVSANLGQRDLGPRM